MINRRKIFGFAAVAPLAAVGITANNAPVQASTARKEDAPTSGPIIQIQAQEFRNIPLSKYEISLTQQVPVGKPLGISVGKDGHMWLKINDEWKRVIVE
jgi:hypothetical protein